MKLHPTPLDGVMVVEPERHDDERGFFARTWCADEMAAAGLDPRMAQVSISWNEHPHTLRGLHFQAQPAPESKLVRCTQGAIFDVAVDLRRSSPTYGQFTAHELTAENRLGLWVPEGCAHGFQTLVSGTEVLYLITVPFQPDLARGLRFDDPAVGIPWPDAPARVVSERDLALPLLADLTEHP